MAPCEDDLGFVARCLHGRTPQRPDQGMGLAHVVEFGCQPKRLDGVRDRLADEGPDRGFRLETLGLLAWLI